MLRCNRPPALLVEWPGSFLCHCRNVGVEQTLNKSQHTKLTLEKKILPLLLPGFELATFRSRVRRLPTSYSVKWWEWKPRKSREWASLYLRLNCHCQNEDSTEVGKTGALKHCCCFQLWETKSLRKCHKPQLSDRKGGPKENQIHKNRTVNLSR